MLAQFDDASALAINAGGDVVGQRSGAPELWRRGASPQRVALPGDGDEGVATGISNDGTIVGPFTDPATRDSHCFMTDAQGTAADLGLPADGRSCAASAINGNRQVVGWATVSHHGFARAFLWQGGQFRNLGVLPGGDSSEALGVNEGGHVVGWSATATASHAFMWSGGVMKDIGTDEHFPYSWAAAINDKGDIVGFGIDENDDDKAVRFAGGRMIDLDSEVDNLADWRLQYAASVNSDGVIVGYGTRSRWQVHAFELVPGGYFRAAPRPMRDAP